MLDASDSRCSTRWGDNGNVDKPKCLLGCATSSKYAVDENAETRCFTRRRPGIKTKESRPTNGFQLGAARCRSARPAICGIGKEIENGAAKSDGNLFDVVGGCIHVRAVVCKFTN